MRLSILLIIKYRVTQIEKYYMKKRCDATVYF